jgi:PncC family amidohydrolase
VNYLNQLSPLIRNTPFQVATAESCTGGLISHFLTNIPGSSRWFSGGVVAYSNRVKMDLLGVQPRTLEQFGAVSPQVAKEMARGACQRFEAQIGLSSTGIAGPTGGSELKPVGLVYLGICLNGEVVARKFNWPYDREGNKEASAEQALQMVVDLLKTSAPS